MYPFIHKFKTKNNYYIYDINTNRTLQVSSIVYDICQLFIEQSADDLLKTFPKYTLSQLEEAIEEIKDAKNDNLFSAHRPKNMAFFNGDDFSKSFVKYPHEQLILNITERCNLRCKYCVYSGHYKGKRLHGENDMSFSCAKEAIDKFLMNCQKESHISFYGGEPLIALDMIKRIVNYVESIKDDTQTINWSLTTNGTLLNQETTNFLYQKKFILTVSLDGPEDIHDRYRVYKNGLGTHKKIINNLKYIYDLDRKYYHSNILFSAVSAPPFNFENVSNYFQEDYLLKDNHINFTYMNNTSNNSIYTMKEDDYKKHNKEKNNFDIKYISDLTKSDRSNMLASSLYEKDAIRYYHRAKIKLGDTIRPNGCCLPGMRRIFVSSNGELYICEKIDDTKPIGTVKTWIDIKLVQKIVDSYIAMSNSCFDCWANRLCSRCFANFIENQEFSPQVRHSECNSTKSQLDKMLIRYYSVFENNPSALDYLSDINLN